MTVDRELITLKKTMKKGFNGNFIFKTNAGPYCYATFNEDFIEIKGRLEKVEVISWCSKDGEPIKPIDSNKYDVKEEL